MPTRWIGYSAFAQGLFTFRRSGLRGPYWDEDFNCMDLFVLLPLDQLKDRYSKHYMRDYIARDGVYAAGQSGTGAAIARDGVYAASMPGATRGAGD